MLDAREREMGTLERKRKFGVLEERERERD